ncbi:MAG: co-chaperone DjlA [Gammaproteobacteria bacterium]|nr:co-chaperone DjlA [Gammaproteobacteria bacterium]MDH5801400.1 co-chaperone DjlA [Gammaproteobacteria bacterium]
MSWWGKIVGGAFGFMAGGPIGAALGAALGHQLDKGLNRLELDEPEDTERVQTVFFTATFSVMGYLAKADGRVSESEIQLARQVMDQMQLDTEQRNIAIRLFQQGKSSDFDVDAILVQFKRECHQRRNLMQMFLEILIATVLADDVIHPQEKDTLKHIGAQLGFPGMVMEQLIKMVQAQQHFSYDYRATSRPSAKTTLNDAYAVLGVTKSADNDEVKKAYRRLMNQHHPDKLVAKGLPEEMMKLATEKTQEIKKAYETVKESRGM